VLKRLKADAELALGQAVDRAVITVPAYFGDAQRKATIGAGNAAGFQVMRIINEPAAATLAYGLNRTGTTSFGDPTTLGTVVVESNGGTRRIEIRLERPALNAATAEGANGSGPVDLVIDTRPLGELVAAQPIAALLLWALLGVAIALVSWLALPPSRPISTPPPEPTT
jgi:hypothetical protein